MVKAVVGANWGDEGKGKITDTLANEADIVVRFQGGANAGHTIVNQYGKFALHTMPSGVFHPDIMNIIGNGMAFDIDKFVQELDEIVSRGVPKPHLMVSDRVQVMMPYHVQFDSLEEARLAGKSFGSTKSGIAPFYSDKFAKIGWQINEFYQDDEVLMEKINRIADQKDVLLTGLYHTDPIDRQGLLQWIKDRREKVKDYLGNVSLYLDTAIREGKNILLEGQLGTMKDPDHGIYPMVTSSSPLAGFAPVGAGVPVWSIKEIIAVTKAYSSCVGEGPFVCEWFGEEAEQLRDAGDEYGAKTGRPRRVGPIDLVATRYGVQMQGATNIALTKLDVLSYMEKIPLCAHYELSGEQTDEFPFPVPQQDAKPVVEYMDGWQCDISGARSWEELPEAARRYVEYVEQAIGCHIGYVSVGPERDSLIIR